MRQRRWLAGLLSVLLAGLGHLYARHPVRAAFLFACDVGLAVVALLAFMFLPSLNLAAPVVYVAFRTIVIWDAARVARTCEHRRPAWLRWPAYALVAWACGYVGVGEVTDRLHRHVVRTVRMTDAGMGATLRQGERVLVDVTPVDGLLLKLLGDRIRPIERGDVILWRGVSATLEPTLYIHRLIGLPGDVIAVRDGRASVNGKVLDEPYLLLEGSERKPFGPWKLPYGVCFALGDRRHQAVDSRGFPAGVVRENRILGRVHRVAYSDRWRRIGARVR